MGRLGPTWEPGWSALVLAPTGTEEPGRVLERWFREIFLGLLGSLGLGLQAGRGCHDLPASCASRTSVEQRWQTPPDLQSSLLSPLNELKGRGFDTLLQSLFGDLKVVQPPAPRHLLSLVLGSLGEGLGGGQQHVLSLVVGLLGRGWGGQQHMLSLVVAVLGRAWGGGVGGTC